MFSRRIVTLEPAGAGTEGPGAVGESSSMSLNGARPLRLAPVFFFPLIVETAQEILELGSLFRSQHGANALTRLLPDLLPLGIQRRIKSAYLPMRIVHDLRYYLQLLGRKVQFVRHLA